MVDRHPPRVAMFVMNPCHSDARVRKEAQSLGDEGYEVRVFALGNRTWPAGLVRERNFTIERLEVVSWYQRTLAWLGRAYRREVKLQGSASRPWPVKAALLPVTALLMLVQAVLRGVLRVARRTVRSVDLATESWDPQRDDETIHAPGTTAEPGGPQRKAGPQVATIGKRGARRSMSMILRTTRSLYRKARLGVRRFARSSYLVVVRLVRQRILVLHRPSVYLEYWKAAGAAAAAWGPDVVHAHDLNALPAALRSADRRAIPVVYDSHELWRHRNRVTPFHPVAKTFDAIQERRLIRRVDLVITVGGCIETWLRRTYRIPPERTAVVRNVPWRRDPTVPAPGLRELSGLLDGRIILYTGRVTSGRGLEEAIDALPILPDDVHILMLGYGEEEYIATLRARAGRAGVPDRLRLVPAVPSEQVPAVASQADVALVAIQPLCLSYRYALPNKLFEAIQAGVPVVASDLPEIRTIVEHHHVGKLYQIGDPEGFARAVRSVLSEPEAYRAGTEGAAEELCWENERDVLIKAYRKVLPASTRRDLSGPNALA